jgi:hypothetical protein
MSRTCRTILVLAAIISPLVSCSEQITAPGQAANRSFDASGIPKANLEVVLRPSGTGSGFGLVKFRQPKDGLAVVELGVWIRDLSPNTAYVLQRANDGSVDDDCTGTNWLTLGRGLDARSILTDEHGVGREELFRDLSAFPAGAAFDIHFRVLDQNTNAVVLQSDCYQFVISV